ncbi:hypothetical protein [Parasitella parasitica]|uniref:Peptide-O-fucosyltransferase n=1 Tax=Parasitella parasitica TaxID=35722 RepID=A0A0B7NLL7_9FUNG|nr:hypothetical protein [Parasitella parasitica]
MAFLGKKDTIKRYTLVAIAFACSLIVPTLIYSLKKDPIFNDAINKQPYKYPTMVKYSYKWPSIPSFAHSVADSVEETDIYKDIDQKYCGQDRCRFLLPIAITEQESKAQLHFRQLAFLAGKIGRTIVLPNVHNSHLGACLPHLFTFYYDSSWLDANKKHFNYITMENFKAWLLERHSTGAIPSGQEIYMQGSRKSRLLTKINNCFGDYFDFSNRPTVSYQLQDHQNQRHVNITNVMINLFSDNARQHEYINREPSSTSSLLGITKAPLHPPPVDVINLFYDRRYKFIKDQDAQGPLPYNQRWVDVADQISKQLTPYMAIHWRMERLEPVSNLLPCAMNLVDQVQQLEVPNSEQKKHPNVFLLTDYPHLLNTTGAKPESNSFQVNELKREHHRAVEYLYQHLNISLTSVNNNKIPYDELPKDNWHILPINASSSSDDGLLPADRSVLGIVDKLVAMKAQWFFAGRPGVCAKSSSFTGRISNSRIQAFKHGDENVILPVKTFDMKKLSTQC